MTNEIVKTPVIVDGIEFYISEDGKRSGMSISGLARLCGVARQTVSELLNKLGEGKEVHECFKPLPDNVFILNEGQVGSNLAVVREEICAMVVQYYAFYSKANNDTAKFTLTKFANKGIHNWIREITNYSEKSEELALLDSIKEVLKEVKELKQTTIKYENIRGKTTVVFPNLDTMLDELALEENLIPEINNEEMTATEWLATKGITLDKSKRHKFAGMLAETYKSMTKKEPKKVVRTAKDGKKNNGVSVYRFDELPILQLCLNKLLA